MMLTCGDVITKQQGSPKQHLPITSEFLNILSPQDKFECSSKHVPGKGHAKGFQNQTEALFGAELF